MLNAIIDIFTDAVVPETADESSKIYIYCIIGFILGAAIVIAWITYKSLTTDAIRSIEALQANVDGSILCTIPYEKNSIYISVGKIKKKRASYIRFETQFRICRVI